MLLESKLFLITFIVYKSLIVTGYFIIQVNIRFVPHFMLRLCKYHIGRLLKLFTTIVYSLHPLFPQIKSVK
jgi:hypothetical protein